MTANFSISGITCEACIKLITRRVLTIDGVSFIKLDLSGKMELESERNVAKSDIIKVLEGTDYLVN